MIDAAPWFVKLTPRHHALLPFFSSEERYSRCSKACASTCPAARPFPVHSHPSSGPFSCIIPHARFLGFGPPTCSDPTRFEAKARSLICQGKATRRIAKQSSAFETEHKKNGLWIVRKHTPRTLGGGGGEGGFALSYAEHAVVGPLSASA